MSRTLTTGRFASPLLGKSAAAVRVGLWAVACGTFLLVLSSLLRLDNVPTTLMLTLLAYAGVSAWRPAGSLLAFAALMPIAMWTGRHVHGGVSWSEVLAVAYLAGYAAHQSVTRPPVAHVLVYAIHLFIAVIVASLAVQLSVLHGTLGGAALWSQLRELVTRDYFIGDGGYPAVDAAMRLIEGALLMHSGLSSGRRAGFGPRLLRAMVIGAAGAGALNLWRVWLGALRLDSPFTAFLRYLTTLRFNTHYGDVNAAGSYFTQALFTVVPLLRSRRRYLWLLAAAAITLSVVLSGSRSAMIAGIAAAAIIWWRYPQHAGGRPFRPSAAVTSVVLAAGAVLIYLLVSRNVTPAGAALSIRAEFARTGLRMVASQPVFGVGVGQYYALSNEFSSPRLVAIFPHENAHNNFLQVMAETGMAGLAALGALLGLAATPIAKALSRRSANGPPPAAVAGALAFVITWLTGHPLLSDDPAFAFWLFLGVLAGWSITPLPEPSRPSGGHWLLRARAAMATMLLGLALSIPLRVDRALASANLEHQAIGVSEWRTSDAGVRYRAAGAHSTVFIPSQAAVVAMPVTAATADIELELRLGGRTVDVLHVPAGVWRTVNIRIPRLAAGPKYLALELWVRGAAAPGRGEPVVLIGKVEPR